MQTSHWKHFWWHKHINKFSAYMLLDLEKSMCLLKKQKTNITYCSTSLLSNMQVWLKHLVCLKNLYYMLYGLGCGVLNDLGWNITWVAKHVYMYLNITVCIYSYVYMYLNMYIYIYLYIYLFMQINKYIYIYI